MKPFEQRRFRDLNAFLRAVGVKVGRADFNIAFYGLLLCGVIVAVLRWF